MTLKDHQHHWIPFGVAAFVADYHTDIEEHTLDALHVVHICNHPECGAWTDSVLDADDRVDAVDPSQQATYLTVAGQNPHIPESYAEAVDGVDFESLGHSPGHMDDETPTEDG